MPLVVDYAQVREVYQEAAEGGIALPAFCTEDRETLEAILASALELGKEIGVEDLPIVPAWTCRYPPRSQMALVTAAGDPILGTRLMFSDLRVFMSDGSPYRKLRVMPHLDHAFPWLDGDVLEEFAKDFASVMCDASEKPFQENVKLTAEYVDKVRGRVIVEGAVDEVFEAGGGEEKNELTTVEQAVKFVAETGVDIVVPNVGTEHRSSAREAAYQRDRAREISRAVGNILCLHGTSSVTEQDASGLPDDGFVKINIYTTLAVHGGQAIARKVLGNLGNIFDEEALRQLIGDRVLGEAVLAPGYAESKPPLRPKLAYVANPPRRDAWFRAVRDTCGGFLRLFHYGRYAR